MDFPLILAAEAAKRPTIRFVWEEVDPVGLGIIVLLLILSMCAWGVMVYKALQMRRARKYNDYFQDGFRSQNTVTTMFEKRITAEGCPMFTVYQDGCQALEQRLKQGQGERAKAVSIKAMEHIKGVIEASVAREAIRLESGLILLAVAVSGSPFIGLFGTVWGVMEVFSGAAQAGSASLTHVAPGVASALATTLAGLLVAIPSMFGYNWLVHNLRVHNVGLDNFAQEFVARMESECLEDRPGTRTAERTAASNPSASSAAPRTRAHETRVHESAMEGVESGVS